MTRSLPSSSELSPKYAIMGFLFLRPMHGYDLHKQLALNLREVWRISQSQVYNILKGLEKAGWITSILETQEKRPDRDLLTLTDLGRAEFETWLYSPTPGSARAIRVEFIARLFFASNLSETLCSRLIQEQADSIRSSLDILHQRRQALPQDQVFNRMGLDLRIRQLLCVLTWVEIVPDYFIEGAG